MELMTTEKDLTMSSLEIAEVLESRHDKVKQSIKRLVKRGVISSPPMGDNPPSKSGGRPTKYYKIGKRDSYVVVAQMSPEFTAALVDRWEALESGREKPFALSRDEVMARGLIAAQEVIVEQQKLIEEAQPKIDFHDALVDGHRTYDFKEAAKFFSAKTEKTIGRNNLLKLLREMKILEKNTNEPYQQFIDRGYLVCSPVLIGTTPWRKIHKQPRLTGKGMKWLMPSVQKHILGGIAA